MKKVWLDTDPGVDDALAFAMLVGSRETIQIVGVSSVFGNAGIDQTTRNALILAETAGLEDIPVARGASQPLGVKLETAEFVHGDNGLGDMPLSEPGMAESPFTAPQAIINAIKNLPGEITLLAIGPLTNIALALLLAPEIAGMVREVVVMGGAVFCEGNATPAAEANFAYDPHAARIVMRAAWQIVLAPLDVAPFGMVPQVLLDKISVSAKPLSKIVAGAMPFYQRFIESTGIHGEVDFPDAFAAGYLIQPEIFTMEEIPIFIETEGACRGQSVPVRRGNWYETEDDFRRSETDRNISSARVMLEADTGKFLALVERLLA
jgi:purine nucleosidase